MLRLRQYDQMICIIGWPAKYGMSNSSAIAITKPISRVSIAMTEPGAPRLRANAIASKIAMGISTQKYGGMPTSLLRGKNITRPAKISPHKVMKTMNIRSMVMPDASWRQQAVCRYEISGEKHCKTERAAKHQRAIGNHLGHRPRQNEA